MPPESSTGRVLVIDASTDYIDFIYRHYPQRAVFVTDPVERRRGQEKPPEAQSEILVAMNHPQTVLTQIRSHMERYGLQPTGVACFDCESMVLSSIIAEELALPYPSPKAVLASRSKFISKERWQQVGLTCPAAALIEQVEEAVDFYQKQGGKIILKPLTGSGSELVFVCTSPEDCANALAIMRRRLKEMPLERMYDSYEADGHCIDPRQTFIAEKYIEGVEYSCDFIIEGASVQIIRIARKWLKPDPAPGIVLAYQVPAELPPSVNHNAFIRNLRGAAKALGIERAICMLDFLVVGDRLVLLEIAPRPGGDCLPALLRESCGMDIFGLELDLAERRPIRVLKPHKWQPLVGLRLFAPGAGTIASIETGTLSSDPRVLTVELTRRPGHRVILPPEDYHSRVLGHAIFRPRSTETVAQECQELLETLNIRYTGKEGE